MQWAAYLNADPVLADVAFVSAILF